MEFNGIQPFAYACKTLRFSDSGRDSLIPGLLALKRLYSSVGLLRRRLRSCCHIGIQWNSVECHPSHMLVKHYVSLVILLILVIQVGIQVLSLMSCYSSVGRLRRLLRRCCHIGIQWNSMESHLSDSTIEPVASW